MTAASWLTLAIILAAIAGGVVYCTLFDVWRSAPRSKDDE